MNKRVLISGVAGFIGSNLASYFLEKGDSVCGFDSLVNEYSAKYYSQNLKRLGMYKDFSFIEADLLDSGKMIRVVQNNPFDFFIHCAARTGVRESLDKPEIYYQTNVLGTKNIMMAIENNQPSINSILFSSSSVYGRQSNVPFVETMSLSPISPYGKTKYQMELMLQDLYKNHKLRMVILRPFSVYGPFGRENMAPHLLYRAILGGKPFDVYGNNQNNQRDWTYISDLISAVNLIMEKYDFQNFETYNLSRGEPIGIVDFIRTIISVVGNNYRKLRFKSLKEYEMSITWGDISKARKQIGYKPVISFKEGIQRTINSFAQQ